MYTISRRKFVELAAAVPVCAILPPVSLVRVRTLKMIEDVEIYTDAPYGFEPVPTIYFKAGKSYTEFDISKDIYKPIPEGCMDSGWFDVCLEAKLAQLI